MNSRLILGFEYTVEAYDPRGRLIDREVVHNLMPYEGLNYMLNGGIRGQVQIVNWYVGIYAGNYTPVLGDTIATFPTNATEATAYTPALRQAYTAAAPSNGSMDNSASPATFTFTAASTIYGGFVTSNSAQGATTGVLLSAVKFASPKSLDVNGQLKVTAGFLFTSS